MRQSHYSTTLTVNALKAHVSVSQEIRQRLHDVPRSGAQRRDAPRHTKPFSGRPETLNSFEEALLEELPLPLTHLIYPEARDVAVDVTTAASQLQTAHCQPAMLCGIALYNLLQQVGITPEVVIGHSSASSQPQVVVCSPEQTARFVARRGRAMAALPGDHGAMAAIMADRDTAAQFLVDGAVSESQSPLPVGHFEPEAVAGCRECQKGGREGSASISIARISFPSTGRFRLAPLLNGLEFHQPSIAVASDRSDPICQCRRSSGRVHEPRHFWDFERGSSNEEAGANLYLRWCRRTADRLQEARYLVTISVCTA